MEKGKFYEKLDYVFFVFLPTVFNVFSYVVSGILFVIYTVSHKKTRHQTLAHNFPKC